MTNEQHSEDVAAKNESSLQTLIRSITFSQGEFSLILLRCNNVALRKRIVQSLYKLSTLQIRAIILPPSVKTLYTSILEKLRDEKPNALIIFGLESVNNLDTVLTSANQVREEFRKNFSFPLLLWVNDEVLQNLIRLATDFENWATTIEFQSTNDELVNFLKQKTDEIFADKANPTPETCWQLKAALKDLQNREQVLEPAIKASVNFVIGLHDYLHGNIDSALEAYQTSLAFWQENYNLERQGILLSHIASAYYRKAEKNPRYFQTNCEESKHYLQQCINILEQAQRPDLVAKYINKLGEVLRHLKAWSDLKSLAEKSLALHQNYGSLLQIAQDYGFLAEVALEQVRCDEANKLAQQTLHFLDIIPNLQPYHFCLYRLILARSQEHLGQLQEAVSNLEKAREESKSQYEPKLYICILDNLHRIYFYQNKYVEAFKIKQEQIQIEYQHGFRAFIGIYYLNSQREAISTVIQSIEKSGKIAKEIPALGREKDVKSLLKRISSTDRKLIIIHGQSGVGKSHLLNAGLIPVLQQQAIGERDALPILLRGYTDWVRMLGTYLVDAFEQVRGKKLPITIDSIEGIVEQLRKNADLNLLTVLIFDQYEEFFIKTDLDNRRLFYNLLRICLNIPFIKVIISLREDCLHYLLECERLIDIPAIENDILILKNRYPIANFSIKLAKEVIHSLTEKSHFFLEPPLIEKLVEDLARNTGEIRPIELQIVGTQLQTHKITSLDKYNQFEEQEKLVQRFLKEIIKDCGASNEKVAELVLYLLTSANGTRPIKTYVELKAGLALESDKLDLVLEILLKSGLVSLIPELHAKRYQLTHDYLVELIRNRVEFPIKKQLLDTFLNQAEKYTTQILTEFDITELPDDKERRLNNRYKLTELLGSGGFSYTHLAEDTHRPGKPLCVVKHLQPARTDEVFLQIARRLFKTEAEILYLLGHHDQIPQLMAYFEENQEFYLVQEYIEGHTLQEELTPGKHVFKAKVIDILKDVLHVLVFVHSRGVIHRDIKPSNLIRRKQDRRIVLIDFGAVKQIQPQMPENPTVAVGTAGYAPPEQFMGHPRLNSDIYAVGMIGIQALTGTPAKHLERESTTALAWRHFAEETTEEFAAILDKMVAFDFQKRYQSAEEVLKDLDKLP